MCNNEKNEEQTVCVNVQELDNANDVKPDKTEDLFLQENASVDNNNLFSEEDVINELSSNVSNQRNNIPNKTSKKSTKKQNKKTVNAKINDANERAKDAILGCYIAEENLRQKRQKPIMIAVLVLLSVQLVLFNVVIFILMLNTAKTVEVEVFSKLLDFLKYYIGAVVVELIGLIVTITANTFSSNLSKKISQIFDNNK